MTWWILLVVWIAGWAYGTRLALTHLMSRMKCPKGNEFLSLCREFHGPACAKPIGEMRERTMIDASIALGMGLAWPWLVLARIAAGATPLTPGEVTRRTRELEQRITDQRGEIDRLHRQLGIGGRS